MYIVIYIIFFYSLSIANSSDAEEVVVIEDVDKVYTSLQRLDTCRETSTLQAEEILNLNNQVELLSKIKDLSEQQKVELSNQLELLKGLGMEQDKAVKELQLVLKNQKEGYEEVIKTMKPSFFETLKNNFLVFSSGLGVGVILILIL